MSLVEGVLHGGDHTAGAHGEDGQSWEAVAG